MSLFSPKRELRALQIEVTSRCTRSCLLCPRFALSGRWRDGDMDEATWRRMEPAFALAEHVHLQGWGEPLLHPSLPAMVRSAKRAGASAGITTNGDLLESAIDWIVSERVDLVTVSVAGNEDDHSRLRGGSSFERIMGAAGKLVARVRQTRRRTKVQVSYLLTRGNAAGLPGVVEAAAWAGVHELFVTHLDVTPNQDLWNRRAFDGDGLRPGVAEYLDAAEATARKRRIRYRGPSRKAEDLLACALNPVRFAFVTRDGRVGPCVNLLFPIDGAVPRWSERGFREVDPVCYGRLGDADLPEVLCGDTRARFAAPFQKRLAAEREFWDGFLEKCGAEALRRLDRLDRRREDALRATPYPAACAGCHKRYGW